MERKLFVREATGLVKQIGAFDSFAMNFAVLNVGIGVVQLFIFAGVAYPGSDVILGMTIGLIPVIFWGIAYAFMSIATPRTGGDYVWISRVLGGPVGFMASWVGLITLLAIIGINANLLSSFYLAPMLLLLGRLTGSPSLEALGASIATPQMIFVLGFLVIIIVGAIAALGLKYAMGLQRILLAIGMIGTLAIIALFFASSTSQFSQLFDAHALQYGLSYQKAIDEAKNAGFVPAFTLSATVMTLPYVSLIYGGFQFNVYAGSETKNVSRTQPIAILGCLLIGWLLFTVLGLGAYHAFGAEFLGAIGYLATYDPSKYTLPLVPTLSYFAGILANNTALTALIEVSFLAWILIIQIPYFVLVPRLMFALAFDRVFPTKIAEVSDKYHTPIIATLVTIGAAVVGLYLFTFTTVFALLSNITLALTIIWFLAGLAAILFPYRRRQIFDNSPALVRTKVAGVPLLTISGIITAAFMAIATIFAWIPSPLLNNLVIVGLFASGLVLYFIIRHVQLRRGIDLAYLYKEIPPE